MIDDLRIYDLKKFHDDRGFFCELHNQYKNKFAVQQINQSFSKKGTLRGIHCTPFWKLITCIKGKVLDVCVDLRSKSKTYLQHYSVELSEDNNKQVYIPGFCGHAFLALEDSLIVYSQGDVYNPIVESSYRFDDPAFKIDWPKMDYIISDKDLKAKYFN